MEPTKTTAKSAKRPNEGKSMNNPEQAKKGTSKKAPPIVSHDHVHGKNCGHTAINHEGHIDYVHDGHLHSYDGKHLLEHTIGVTNTNPNECSLGGTIKGHDEFHVHGKNCGHEAIPHGDHTDYLVDGHLHHVHSDHCDDHGKITLKN